MNEATRLTRDLVAIPSVNPMGRPLTGPTLYEGRVSDYLSAYFADLGVPHERTTVMPGRDNVIARFDPPCPASRSLILEAHQDTVPVDDMIIDPFGARIENGRLYGRGACDDKGPMASMLVAFARLVRERPKTATRVYMICSADEEFGFSGIRKTCESPMVRERDLPMTAVCAEATVLDIVTRHKGAARWFLETGGKACHSSSPWLGVNAVYRMAELLPIVERYALELQAKTPDPLLGTPTLSVGVIDGGVSANTVPEKCRVSIDRRTLPDENLEEVFGDFLTYMKRHVPPGVVWSCTSPRLNSPPLDRIAGSEELSTRLGSAIDAVVGKHRCIGAPYGTDAAPLALVGVPSVVFGPGDIAKAHTADEWIELDQLEPAAEILYRLACQE
jgi:acetylornithine deacetylase/succinyl-diaminopimelate desuccinylase-like protein